MQNLLDNLKTLLLKDERLVSEGELLKNKITDIRIYFDSKRDVKVGKNHDLKLKSYFYCILNCK